MIETWITAGMAGVLTTAVTGIGTALLLTRTGKESRRELTAEIETLGKTLENMHREAGDLRKETSELRRMSEEADRIKSEHAALDKRKEEVEAWAREEIRKLDEVEAKRRSGKNEAIRLHDEVATMQARKARLEEEVKSAEETHNETRKVKGELEATRAKLHAVEAELEWISEKVDRAKKAQQAADQEREKAEERLSEIEERRRIAESAAAEAKERTGQIAKGLAEQQVELEQVRERVDELKGEREETERRLDALEEEERSLKIRRDMMEKDLEGLRSMIAAGDSDGEPDRGDRKGNLATPPYLRYGRAVAAATVVDEQEKLEQVIKAIKEQGLSFRDRVVHRFHTSLKVSRISPLTVLAGISGTGKTQLPRSYSRAIGMECLVVPVQPRWDGPRDLLGHFDFLHRRFQATELARLLYDYTHTERDDDEQSGQYRLKNADDRIAIVLLDEMNLARTEYYFSEFLSRLELQGKEDEEPGAVIDKDRMVDLDIPYLEEKDAVRVFPTQRILWVGTMNEDESTMTLSDKVIDRANILRFARPTDMSRQNGAASKTGGNEGTPNRHLSAKDWNEWCKEMRPVGSATDLIERINEEIMEPCGRSFGHRMREAMMKYVQVYTGRGWEEGLADQIEMRLLPKLQGVDAQMDKAGDAIAQLAQICGSELEDDDLAESIRKAQTEMQQTGTFNWNGRELQ